MLESIRGFDRSLNPPDDPRHHSECPAHEDNRGDDAVCLCEELADAEYQDAVDRKMDECREG